LTAGSNADHENGNTMNKFIAAAATIIILCPVGLARAHK
jgi:hypothetical protein